MSLLNLIVQRDKAYLFTDSGHFRRDGTIAHLVPKVLTMHPLSLAMASVGQLPVTLLLPSILESPVCDQRTFVRGLPGMVKAEYAARGLDHDRNWSIFAMAFYSAEMGRPIGLLFSTSSEAGPDGMEPWRLYPAPTLLMPQVDSGDVFGATDLADAAAFDPARDMMPMIEAQRLPRSGWGGDCDLSVGIAGDIEMTTVSADGVRTVRFHSYPDEVGRRAA